MSDIETTEIVDCEIAELSQRPVDKVLCEICFESSTDPDASNEDYHFLKCSKGELSVHRVGYGVIEATKSSKKKSATKKDANGTTTENNFTFTCESGKSKKKTKISGVLGLRTEGILKPLSNKQSQFVHPCGALLGDEFYIDDFTKMSISQISETVFATGK